MPSTAAQCVAYIACAELPEGSWPEMMTVLTTNVTNSSSTEMLKESSLEAVGYICQDIVCNPVHFLRKLTKQQTYCSFILM